MSLIVVARDVTARRRADRLLRLQSSALEAAANAILITDRDGRIEWVNPAFTRLTGWSAEEAVGRTPRILKSGAHEPAFYETLWRTILAGHVWHGEIVNRRRDGSLYTERETITPVRNAADEITHFVSIKQDVTAYKQASAELERRRELLHQNEKLAAMGQLLAGVAHELNNPLTVVLGQGQILMAQAAGTPIAQRAKKIAAAAERCSRIVKNFLALARQSPPERHRVSVNETLGDTLELLAYALRTDGVEVVLELGDGLPLVWADPHQLQQVFLNLLTNAQQAMQHVPRTRRRLTVVSRAAAEPAGVRVEIRDTGPGISPELRRRIFEPFFTTKPLGQGTGLGLPLCLGIVEAHGGRMGVGGAPGEGATFWVELPVGTAPVPANGDRGTPAAGALAGRRILVVDDEPAVVEVIAQLLSREGCEVDGTTEGAVALEKLQSPVYDLVLTDLRMPGLDGTELYREVERRRPGAGRRFMFVTGDVLSPETRTLLERGEVAVLAKPFEVGELLDGVRQALREADRATATVA